MKGFEYQARSLSSTLRFMPLKISHRSMPKAGENIGMFLLTEEKKAQPKR